MALYPLVRPLLFALDAERAHDLSLTALALGGRSRTPVPSPALAVTVAGLRFPSPLGLAAGYDKNAVAVVPLLGLGFGSVEVGTLTPQPQPGNPKPRLFRLVEDRAVINRFGFNNRGQADAHRRLAARNRARGLVGVNVGANKDSTDRVADYAIGIAAMKDVADYLTINISSPNTPGLRRLQDAGALDALLEAAVEARGEGGPPLFLKVAPDLEPSEIDAIARVTVDRGVDALIVSNTTVTRPPLRSIHSGEAGGLSGTPLGGLALARLRDFRCATGGTVPLVAAGGVSTAEDVYARLHAGASLVQLYSALVYEGPGLPRRILADLGPILARNGFSTVAEAIAAPPR